MMMIVNIVPVNIVPVPEQQITALAGRLVNNQYYVCFLKDQNLFLSVFKRTKICFCFFKNEELLLFLSA